MHFARNARIRIYVVELEALVLGKKAVLFFMISWPTFKLILTLRPHFTASVIYALSSCSISSIVRTSVKHTFARLVNES